MRSVRCWIAAVVAVCFVPLVSVQAAQKLGDIPVSLQFPPQGAPSVVINSVTQSSGGWQFDVNFDLTFAEGAPCDIVLEYQGGAVVTWTEANGVTGSVSGIYPDTSYNLTWDAQVDLPSASGELYQIRLTAKCGVYEGTPVDDGKSYKIPDGGVDPSIEVIAFERELPSNCFTITYKYNELVTDYSVLWTDELLNDTTGWNEIPYVDLIGEVLPIGGETYTWTDCGDPMATVPRDEPDNDSVPNRLYYLKVN